MQTRVDHPAITMADVFELFTVVGGEDPAEMVTVDSEEKPQQDLIDRLTRSSGLIDPGTFETTIWTIGNDELRRSILEANTAMVTATEKIDLASQSAEDMRLARSALLMIADATMTLPSPDQPDAEIDLDSFFREWEGAKRVQTRAKLCLKWYRRTILDTGSVGEEHFKYRMNTTNDEANLMRVLIFLRNEAHSVNKWNTIWETWYEHPRFL
jgi:hypothetical protein